MVQGDVRLDLVREQMLDHHPSLELNNVSRDQS
jgi:hypothetical protein